MTTTPDPSQPHAPPGCVFGPHNLSGAWVAVVEGATGTLAAIEWCERDREWCAADARKMPTRAAIFSAAFSHARKRADAAETTARGVAEQLRSWADALTHARKVAAAERALRIAEGKTWEAAAGMSAMSEVLAEAEEADARQALCALGVDP